MDDTIRSKLATGAQVSTDDPVTLRWSVMLLVLLVVIAYFPASSGGFIWDDDDHLTRNPSVQSVDGLKEIWSSLEASRYYPLTLTSFWMQHRLWGLHPFPYHGVNILLQAANAVLLWMLLRRLQVPGAWVAAALWAVHPVNVETVAWITELKNTQSGFFLLIAMLLFLKFEDELRRRDYLLALLCGAAAMLSKPSTVVLPGVLLLCTWWRHGRWTLRDLMRVAPLVALAFGMSLLTIIEQRHHIADEGTAEWTLTVAQRIVLASRAVWFYAGKLIWPVDVCFIYPRWELPTDSVLAWVPLAGLALVAGTTWHFRRASWGRAAIFGLGCFAFALLPVLGLFDIYFFRYSFVADHFQYLASAGMIALMVAAAGRVLEKAAYGSAAVAQWAGVVILTALVALTWRQSQVYADSEELYRATIARNPTCWLAHNNLGGLLSERGELDEAIEHFQQVLRFTPADAGVHNNLGTALFRQGNFAEAAGEYREAVRLKPDYAEARYNFGNILAELSQPDDAAAQYQEAIRLQPEYEEAHYNLANTLVRLNRTPEALEHYQTAVRLRPSDVEARYTLANTLAQQGNLAEAVMHYQRAVQIRPDFANAHFNLGNALLRLGRTDEAIEQYRWAVELEPGLVPARFNLATALLTASNVTEAIDQYQQVLALKPDLAQAHYKLGVAAARLGEFEKATNHCGHALRLNPEFPLALGDYAWLLATHDGSSVQDARRSVECAEQSCRLTGNGDPSFLAALGAAYASAGQFTNAITTAEMARAWPGRSVDTEWRRRIEDQIKSYRAGQPYRVTLPAPLPSDW